MLDVGRFLALLQQFRKICRHRVSGIDKTEVRINGCRIQLSPAVIYQGLRGFVLAADTEEFIHDFSVQQLQEDMTERKGISGLKEQSWMSAVTFITDR